MALTPELASLKVKLETLGYAKRTTGQDRLLDELSSIDKVILQKTINESSVFSSTRMTSPGGGACACCGK